KEVGEEALQSRLYFMGTNDLGDLVTVSGAAILKSSKNQEAAQQFMAYATSEEGQQILTRISAQYPMNPNVNTEGLKPFSELTPPNGTLDLGEYSDGKAAIELLQEVGLLYLVPLFSSNRARQSTEPEMPFGLVLSVVLLVVLSSLPVLYVLLRAQYAGWAYSATLILRPRILELLF